MVVLSISATPSRMASRRCARCYKKMATRSTPVLLLVVCRLSSSFFFLDMCVCACMRKFKCLATRVFGLHTNRKGTNSSSSTSTSNRRSIPPPAPTPRTLTPHPPPSSSSYTRSISPDSSNLSVLAAVCGCGRSLEPGWDCLACRSACPNCGRALAVNEECGRCAAKQSSLKHQERLETQY